MTLERLGGNEEQVPFTWESSTGYYRGEGTVMEPHSFDVVVSVLYNDKRSEWEYESHEGRVQISAQMAKKPELKQRSLAPELSKKV